MFQSTGHSFSWTSVLLENQITSEYDETKTGGYEGRFGYSFKTTNTSNGAWEVHPVYHILLCSFMCASNFCLILHVIGFY